MGYTSTNVKDNLRAMQIMMAHLTRFQRRRILVILIWPRSHSCDILVNNVTVFYPCPKTLSEAKFKSSGLLVLAEDISI